MVARAVLFSSIVDDPGDPDYTWPADPKGDLSLAAEPREHTTEEIEAERQRLHDLITELVQWESTTNEHVLNRIRGEILRATDDNPPPVLDPFAGGGSIPLEAQRLGLEAHAADLNPVAVLINKALIEIPPKFANMPPVNPEAQGRTGHGAAWKGAAGLAADIRYYGKWMRDEAENRIGHLYPKVQLPTEKGGGEATVIAWLWARTVKCPNPACGNRTPLVSSFWLSKKKGKEAWVEPEVDRINGKFDFTICTGIGAPRIETVTRKGASCLFCDAPMPFSYLRSQGKVGGLSQQLMAVVAEGQRGRIYIEPTEAQENVACGLTPQWIPEGKISHWPGRTNVVEYGLTEFHQLFTDRQLVALTTFSDLIERVRQKIVDDTASSKKLNGLLPADAIVTYLALAISRWSDLSNSVAGWNNTNENVRALFARQAIPMAWDYAELNPFGLIGSPATFFDSSERIVSSLQLSTLGGTANQFDAMESESSQETGMVSTDPPYYDNIGYADLSDFFYVWLRHSLRDVLPDLFRTVQVPKAEELVASPYRFTGGKKEAKKFFEDGLEKAFRNIHRNQIAGYPVTIYYAFKQAESSESVSGSLDISSTGWETMLEGLVRSGFSITATWPIRTERGGRMIGLGANALASSIVLACRVRPTTAPQTTRNDFLRQLRRELPARLKTMQAASIAPVDLAQAAIGPGMAIYSRYSSVLEPTGDALRVRTALQLINQVLDEVLTDQDSEHDRETGWAVSWFEQYGTGPAEFGRAETLATARNISVNALSEAGVITSSRGKVQLIPREKLSPTWNPTTDKRLIDWEIVQHLIRTLETDGQEGAARLKRRIGTRADIAKDLAYRLYTIAERKKWAQEALAYNGLVVVWNEVSRIAGGLTSADYQAELTL